jgi:hypothetical protein
MGGRQTVTAVLRAHNVELRYVRQGTGLDSSSRLTFMESRPLARFDETKALDQEPNDARGTGSPQRPYLACCCRR